ncbi:MAG: phosphatidate cytidylyltransferase [Candidatus Zipacnadales bacterium]
MLKTKVITTLVGLPFLLLLLYLGGWVLFVPATVIMLIGLHEFYSAMRLRGIYPMEWGGWLCAIGIMFVTQWFAHAPEWRSGLITACLAAAVLMGMIAQFWRTQGSSVIENSGATVFGVVYVALLFSFFLRLRTVELHESTDVPLGGFRDRAGALLLVIIAVWSCDAAAQLVGRFFGRLRLWPTVSPHKTFEGSAAGLLTCVSATLVFGCFLHLPPLQLLGLGLVLGVLGQFGDLCKSMIKRELGIKDFGNIIPGHGGVLDRFDSLLFTMPVAYGYFRLFVMPF